MSGLSMFRLFTAGLACMIPFASAYTKPTGSEPEGNAFSQPGLNSLVPAGETWSIDWSPTTEGTVTLLLLKGPSSAELQPIGIIAESISNSGTYVWHVSSDLEPSKGDSATGYGIELIVDATGQYQYTDEFGISNPSWVKGESWGTLDAATAASTSTSSDTKTTTSSATGKTTATTSSGKESASSTTTTSTAKPGAYSSDKSSVTSAASTRHLSTANATYTGTDASSHSSHNSTRSTGTGSTTVPATLHTTHSSSNSSSSSASSSSSSDTSTTTTSSSASSTPTQSSGASMAFASSVIGIMLAAALAVLTL